MTGNAFPQDEDIIYLNHAGVGPWPAHTRDAVKAFAETNVARGAADYPRWLQRETRLRERLADLIQADSRDDVALIKNTSEGLSFIAYGLPWKEGDEVIINSAEFPSNRIVWESLSHRFGVTIRDVDLGDGDTPEQALLAAFTPRTRLLAVSSVQYGTGLRMDLAPLGRACKQHGVLFCVDAIQSLGALRFNRSEADPDFVVADGHKWMLGPEGLGVLWCRPSLLDLLQPSQYGWHMIEKAGDYSRKKWEVASTARRFECGSPNMLGIHGLEASLAVLQDDAGLDAVERGVLDNTALLIDAISQEQDLELLSPGSEARRSGIVTFRATGDRDSRTLYRRLMQRGVICAGRGGGVRFSPHFYTPAEKLHRAVAVAAKLTREL